MPDGSNSGDEFCGEVAEYDTTQSLRLRFRQLERARFDRYQMSDLFPLWSVNMRPRSVGSMILTLSRSRGTVVGVSRSLSKLSSCWILALSCLSFRLVFTLLVVLLVVLLVSLCASSVYAEGTDGPDKSPVEIKLTDRVPYGREPVDYFGAGSHDAVSELQKRLDSRTARLTVHERFGYLLSVAELLDVHLE